MYCHIKAYSSIFFTGDLTSHCRAIVIIEFSSFFFLLEEVISLKDKSNTTEPTMMQQNNKQDSFWLFKNVCIAGPLYFFLWMHKQEKWYIMGLLIHQSYTYSLSTVLHLYGTGRFVICNLIVPITQIHGPY